MALPPVPTDILAADPSLRSELLDSIRSLIDAAQPTAIPGENNDLVMGTALSQTINGQSGNDVIAALGGDDGVFGGFGNDYVLAGIGNDGVYSGDGNDILFGEAGNDILYGANGDDAMFGGVGNDTLAGGAGVDGLYGGVDNDFISGGADANWLVGGLGDDVFYYASRFEGFDVVTDFSSGDRFEFFGLGFGVNPGADLNDGTTFVANTAPTSVVAEATVLYDTDAGQVWFDVDGAGALGPQLIATLTGAPQVNADDFIFV